MNTTTMIYTPPRYLPVTRQEGFDLRGHIESAGHQVNFLADDGFSMQLHTGVCFHWSAKTKLTISEVTLRVPGIR